MIRRRVVVGSAAAWPVTAALTSWRHIYAYNFGQVDMTRPFHRAGSAAAAAPHPTPAVALSAGSHTNPYAPSPTMTATTAQPTSTAMANTAAAAAALATTTTTTPTTTTQLGAAGDVRVTRLHNGVRVITHDLGGPVVSVGAYVLAGPVYDPPNCPGVGAMMHLALTTSNYNNSLFQLDRNLRSVGAAEAHYELYKHFIAIRLDARADKWRAQAASADAMGGSSSDGDDDGGSFAVSSMTRAARAAKLKEEMTYARHPDPRVAAMQQRNRERYVQRQQELAQHDEREQQARQRRLLQQSSAARHFRLNLVQDNLFTCLAAPRFHETDIERFRDTIDNEVRERKWRAPAAYAVQMLETVAFYREPLGNPRFVPENNNGNISNEVLLQHYSRYVVPANIVIAGVNVDHSALIAEYENTPYPHSSRAPHHTKAAATHNSNNSSNSSSVRAVDATRETRQYTGGELVQQEERAKDMGTRPDMDADTICALGWLTSGGRDRRTLPSYATSMVVRQLLDMALACDAVSGGNPVRRYEHDEEYAGYGVRAFCTTYMTAGLLGFTVHCAPAHAVRLITDTTRLLQEGTRITSSAGGGGAATSSAVRLVDQSRLAAAKRRAALQYISDCTDSIRDYCDFLGTALPLDATQTRPVALEEVLSAIDHVTEADVARLREEMFSQPTSMFAHGEVLGLPSLRQMGL